VTPGIETGITDHVWDIEKLLHWLDKSANIAAYKQQTPDSRPGVFGTLCALNLARRECQMKSEKVLIMPSRLRREENPPYPEYDIKILSAVLEINDKINGSFGETKDAIKTLESELKNQGERLGTAIKTLEVTSHKHGETLDGIGKDVHAAKVTVRVLVGLILVGASLIGWVVTTYIAGHASR